MARDEQERAALRAQLLTIRNDCAKLEERAGIAAAVERAREGRFIPLGVYSDEVKPEEVDADNHDVRHERMRAVCFGVADVELRKQLIASRRRESETVLALCQAHVRAEQQELAKARREVGGSELATPIVVVIAGGVLGKWLWAIPGSVIGTAVGLLAALEIRRRSRADAPHVLKAHEESLKEAERDLREELEWPAMFTEAEEQTGQRSAAADMQPSATQKYWQQRRSEDDGALREREEG